VKNKTLYGRHKTPLPLGRV